MVVASSQPPMLLHGPTCFLLSARVHRDLMDLYLSAWETLTPCSSLGRVVSYSCCCLAFLIGCAFFVIPSYLAQWHFLSCRLLCTSSYWWSLECRWFWCVRIFLCRIYGNSARWSRCDTTRCPRFSSHYWELRSDCLAILWCVLLNTISISAKASVLVGPNLQILDPMLTSPSHTLARKRKKGYELNLHF